MNRFAPFEQRKDVWLNDIAFSSIDELGNRWTISDIDGWWDLPTPTIGEVDRAYTEDGSFYEPGRFESRVIRLKGYIQPPNRSTNAANIARQQFNRRLQLVRKTGLLRVLESQELGGGKQSEVVIVARPLISSKKINGTIEFDVQFRANDPRKYSIMEERAVAYILNGELGGRTYDLAFNRNYTGTQARNTVTVDNRGDYNTYGALRFKGPVDNPGATHIESGKFISFTNVRLGVNQYLDVNLLEKTVITDAGLSLRERMTPDSRWFNFEPGVNQVSYYGTQYISPVPSVEDARNWVLNPSYEYVSPDTPSSPVRKNYMPNASGTVSTVQETLRDFMGIDPQAIHQSSFATGTVSNGVITGGPVTLRRSATSTRFPTNGWYPFVQLEVNPTTDATNTATLTAGTLSSGPVAIPKNTWTTIRVDGAIISGTDFESVLTIPNVSAQNSVKIRNIMVLRSPKPLAGVIDFWDGAPKVHPERGTDVFYYEPDNVFRERTATPSSWSIVNNTNAYMYVDPKNTEVKMYAPTDGEYIIDFGKGLVKSNRFYFGALSVGAPVRLDLIDTSTGSVVKSVPYENKLFLYEGINEINPSLRLVTNITQSSPTFYTIPGATFTVDGGTTVFTDKTEARNAYTYDVGSGDYSAYELVPSYTASISSNAEYNTDSTISRGRARRGTSSLMIRYSPETAAKALETPIIPPTSGVTTGTKYVRASFMSNRSANFEMTVAGITTPVSTVFRADSSSWTDVTLEISTRVEDTPTITVKPTELFTSETTLYVDSVAILNKNIEYFDGSSGEQYRWNGTPHQSISDTIARAGVPRSELEIIYRSAWIG